MSFAGIHAPPTTPFHAATGEADAEALRDNLRAWLAAPLDGVVLFGSTGEGPLLDEDEKTRLTAAARDVVDGGRLLLAGTGAESTRATIRATRAVAAEGADAVLVQPPAYYRPLLTRAALRDHFVAVADASPVPVLLYQVPPAFSGMELPADLVAEVAAHPNVAGIKDSSGDLGTLGALVDACDGRAEVLCGSGAVLHAALERGAVGGILAVSLLAPHECAALRAAFAEGRADEAARLQETLAPLHRRVVAAHGVPGMKAALEMRGLHGGAPRPPVRPLDEAGRAAVREALDAALLRPLRGDTLWAAS